MKRTLLITFSIVILFVILTISLLNKNSETPKLTAEEQKWLALHENDLVIIGDPAYLPTNFVDSSGNQAGITPELFERMEKFLNIKIHRKNMDSWEAALKEARTNPNAVLGGIMKTEDRLHDLLFTQSYITIPTMIVVDRKTTGNLNLEKLQGKSIAVPKSYAIEEYLIKNHPELKLTPVINEFEGLQKVSTGEVEVILTDLPSVSYLMEKYKIPNLRIAGESGYAVNLCFASHRTNPILNSILIKALSSVTEQEKQMIINKWITIDYNKFLFSRSFWITIITTISLFLIVLMGIKLWNRSLYQMVKSKTAELRQYQNHLEEMVLLKTADLQSKNEQLQYAFDHVQQLQGILPICASCKKIRDDNGYWNQVERYFQERSDVSFSHSTCPECTKKLYGEYLSDEELKSLNCKFPDSYILG